MHWEIIVVILSSLVATVQIISKLKSWIKIINGKKLLTIRFQIQTCKFIQLKAKDSQKHSLLLVFIIIQLFPRKKLFSSLAVTVQMA